MMPSTYVAARIVSYRPNKPKEITYPRIVISVAHQKRNSVNLNGVPSRLEPSLCICKLKASKKK